MKLRFPILPRKSESGIEQIERLQEEELALFRGTSCNPGNPGTEEREEETPEKPVTPA